MTENNALSVSELNEYVRKLLASDVLLRSFKVSGEISGYKLHFSSGHRYFTLKDDKAAVPCVMFRQDALTGLDFEPQDGMKVVLSCSASIYPRDGRFQLYVRRIEKLGIGELYMRFEALKKKLESEGLFDPALKRDLPRCPKCIGIATSGTGAALRDMVRIARRRNPHVGIIIAPCAVQGAGSEREIAAALELLNKDGRAEVILCGRGGGSIEDLWAFNEEITARAIAASRIPVISCVGHETDFTIADFVADMRAATPSMAAEIAVPDIEDMRSMLRGASRHLISAARGGNALRRERLTRLASANVLHDPRTSLIDGRRAEIDRASERFARAYGVYEGRVRSALEKQVAKLAALNPGSILERGYTYVVRGDEVIQTSGGVERGQKICIHWRDGTADATIS